MRAMGTYEAVVGDQAEGLLLRFAVDGAKRGRQTARGQTVDVGLPIALL